MNRGGGWGNIGMAFEVKNSVTESNMTWDVVMMEHPFFCNVWSHANDPFSESLKDVYIKELG